MKNPQESMDNQVPVQEAPAREGAAAKSPKATASRKLWLGRLGLFCGISVYLEFFLHLFLFRTINSHIVYPILFGLMTGVLTAVLVSLLPKVGQRIAAVVLVLLQCALADTQLIYHAVFGNLMPISQVTMGGGVITDFLDQTLYAIRQNILPFLALLLPLAVVIVLIICKRLKERIRWQQAVMAPVFLCVLAGLSFGLMYLACGHPVPVWHIFHDARTSTDMSYQNVGMAATTFQELRYLAFGGAPEEDDFKGPGGEASETYDPELWNVMPELDFEALAASADDEELSSLDRYMAQLTPTPKNEYTGRLAGYNLIVLCAESYSPLFVSEELTPTLYKMSHSGLVFENFYGTFNSMTTNGEYTTCLSLYPDMTRAKYESSFDVSVGHYLPFSLGLILKDYGYSTWAYHNNNAEFYNRSQTHPNMGYNFQAQGSGLEITPQRPASDLEMMEKSMDDYLGSDQPFHAYYMTYSGHYHYSWDNAMSAKHRAEVENLPYSDEVKAYVACNLEVEYALEYIERRLEEAGKLNNTLIVLTNDHYPYGLSAEQYDELAGRPIDTAFERYHNHFICYAPGLGETVNVKTYCCTADILPTVLNLLGIRHDSRLLAGVDVMADTRHAAILYDGSFVTDGFRYNESTGELIPDPGVTVDAEMLRDYRDWVSNKFTLSRKILNTDYYAHVFPDEHHPQQGGLEIPFDDEVPVRTQGNILFIYRKGLMDLYGERTFGPDERATLGDWVTALYRFEGSPEMGVGEGLPEHYLEDRPEALEKFRQSPQYSAVCWAFREGLLRGDDRVKDFDAEMTNVEFALMIYRNSERMGKESLAPDLHVLDDMEIHNDAMTDTEREAVAWAVGNGIIKGNGEQTGLFDAALEQNYVTRYRVVLILMWMLYPEMTR